MKYKSVKGMDDILPQDVWMWQFIEMRAREGLESSGYAEIRTPILEDTAVFVRGIGDTTDIVTKEMFTFSDRKGRSLTMRPEGTAPIARSYIEHSIGSASAVARLYYMGPMFRAERPQKGRLRQFYQIGVEVIGSSSPMADVEVITRLDAMLRSFGLDDFTIKINSLGCRDDKSRFAGNLKDYLSGKESSLCDDCKARIGKNVLRVLDCKNESCVEVVRASPNTADSLCGGCRGHFEEVKSALKSLGVDFTVAGNLVRGLDYYTATVFEVTHPALGGQDAIGAGGRYDNLIKDMGGPDTGAVGYALGMERIMIALKGGGGIEDKKKNIVYIATIGKLASIEGMKVAERLKRSLKVENLVVLGDIGGNSIKSQMRSADKAGARAVIVIGEDEIKDGKLTVKDMMSDVPQATVSAGSVIEELRRILC